MKHLLLSILASFVLLGCGGGGGGGTTKPVVTATIPAISHYSYENEQNFAAVMGEKTLPTKDAWAYADFLNDGTLTLVTHSLEYTNTLSQYQTESLKKGHVQFWKSSNGAWIDITSNVMGANSTTGCLHPRKAVVSDFIISGEPSVVVACHGFDGAPWTPDANGAQTGEEMLLIAKDNTGKYKITSFGGRGYYHGVSAADLDNDGRPDLIVADFLGTHTDNGSPFTALPFAFKNDGNGNFSPKNIFGNNQGGIMANNEIFTIEIVKDGGNTEVFVGGHDIAKSMTVNLQNSSIDNSLIATTNNLASFVTPAPFTSMVALDAVKKNGIYYLNMVDPGYTNIKVVKYETNTATTSTVYDHAGSYPQQWSGNWFPWLFIINGIISSGDSKYVVNVAQ